MNNNDFENFGLDSEILKSISMLNYKKPSKVQEKVIPEVLHERDIIVKSQTGSGKTAAFAIPVCQKIELEANKPQVLVLTPTRELCVQVKEDMSNIGRFKRIRCTSIFGKQPFSDQAKELKQRTHVVVGTPGRTLDHLERGTLETDAIKYFIIDEADEMLNMGFIEQVEAIACKLPAERVTMLFSATIPDEVEQLCQKYMNSPIKIEMNPEKITTERIKHMYYEVEESRKFNLLNKVIITENPDSCIIFCRTKENTGKVASRLRSKGYPCSALHGGMLQDDRLNVMNSFKRGEFIFLVATDVASRGIDVENVTHIINYDIPMEKESYVHRIGRTGRAGSDGVAITFACEYENKYLSEIEDYIGFKIEKRSEPLEDEVENARAAFEIKIKAKPKLKKDKSAQLNKEITKIYINAGKKKKIRAGDIVGAITNIEGVNADDVGIIDIQDNYSYIDILGGKGNIVMDALKSRTIKGKALRVEKAEK